MKDHLPHLDGIRGIALVGVLFFHFEVPGFSGGYCGVDVFLSLSGYLITRKILRDIEEKKFSIRKFYIKRFRRLYPASLATVLITVVFAQSVFPNCLFEETYKSALFSASFSSNFYFHKESGYFETESKLKPLLHMWSLSLEEQFYFAWPFLMVLVSNCETCSQIKCHLLLTIGSFLIANISFPSHPSFTFYQLPSRVLKITKTSSPTKSES